MATKSASTKLPAYTKVEPGRFVTPVKRLGVSGGTAPFFSLQEHRQGDVWIGKDLSHALDEITFYEQVHRSRDNPEGGFQDLLRFMFGYEGVLEAREDTAKPGDPPLNLIVMQNLRAGAKKLRMLDIKIGEKTAAAGWQGKSRLRAMKQSLVDSMTNSYAEGFRLEGFDEQPPALLSIDPLLDIGGSDDKKLVKTTHRMMLQRMSAADFLTHFLDVHQVPGGISGAQLTSTLAPVELIEIVHRETVSRLHKLATACRQVTVPQKWIGSSVALAFDAGELPRRSAPEANIRKKVKVFIFDWGRSEFNTPAKYQEMSASDKADRQKFWKSYTCSLDRLAFEVERAYQHRFSSTEWKDVRLTVYDFDSMSENDFLGRVEVRLNEHSKDTTVILRNKDGNAVNGKTGPSSITFSIERRSYPSSSRMLASWRIHVQKAANLPVGDALQGSSDPFVEIEGISANEGAGFTQQTSIVAKNLNPTWNESFDLPLLRKPLSPRLVAEEKKSSLFGGLISWFACSCSPSVSRQSSSANTSPASPKEEALPPQSAQQQAVEKALDAWRRQLDSEASVQ